LGLGCAGGGDDGGCLGMVGMVVVVEMMMGMWMDG